MLVRRWQAPVLPDKSQIRSIYEAEGLVPQEEIFPPDSEVGLHFHPFDEVRTVAEGELIFDIAGNKLLLRAGDRIIIPANTKHSFKIQGGEPCVCFCAPRIN